MTARRYHFPTIISTRRLLKLQSAKFSPDSNDSSSRNKKRLLQQWDQYQQRVQTILQKRPDLGRHIVDGLGKVLNIIDCEGTKPHGTKS